MRGYAQMNVTLRWTEIVNQSLAEPMISRAIEGIEAHGWARSLTVKAPKDILEQDRTSAARRVNAAKAAASEVVRHGRPKKTKEPASAEVAVKRKVLPMAVPDDDWRHRRPGQSASRLYPSPPY